MRKETVNTFSDGMSLDLNPLGTPAKTLTNCLNGTLITYNGNELTLQNDMGNAPVGTSYLPEGYVPIGMKEHGGIIYVASYNPKTNKGQLGCFPSPQLIYTSEAAQTVLDINLQDILLLDSELKQTSGVPVIEFDEYKEEIFKDSITQEARIFNTGDKYIIKTNKIFSNDIRLAIDDNIIVLKLFIIPTNGSLPIEISEDLRTYDDEWDKSLWIFLNIENIPFETILSKHDEYLQVFPGPQGTLEIVIEFNTFLLFNLYRLFTPNNNIFDVTFVGEAEADISDNKNPVDKNTLIPFSLYGNINNESNNLDEILQLSDYSEPSELIAYINRRNIPQNETLYYDIMPTSKYGALKLYNNSFLKSGQLTNEGVLLSHNKITNWNFEINSDNAIIKWTYTTFVNDPAIDHMRFVFIPLDKVLESGGLNRNQLSLLYITASEKEEPQNNPNIYTIKKLIYSGDFEDLITLGEEGLLQNYIYLCRLDIIYVSGQIVNGHQFKLLYTGTFFNDKDVEQFNNDNRPLVSANCDITTELTYTIKSFSYTTILEDESVEGEDPTYTVIEKEIVNANDVMFLADDERWYKKIVGIIINVQCEVTSTLALKQSKFLEYDGESSELRPLYAGIFDSTLTLDNCASGNKIYCIVKNSTKYNYEGDGDEEVLNKLKEYIEHTETIQDGTNPSQPLDGATITYTKEGNTYKNTSTITIHRGIVSKLGKADFYTTLHEGLFPVYEPDDVLYNEKLFGFLIEEDGSLSNIIAGDNFMGLALYLAKRRNIDASTSTFEQYIKDEKLYGKKTAISKFDIDNQKPYSYGATLTEGSGLVNPGSEGTSRIEAITKSNNCPINIIASNGYERLWDKSYRDGNVDGRITNLMCLPHSEIFEKVEGSLQVKYDTGYVEKAYGAKASYVRSNFIKGKIDSDLLGNKDVLFHASHGIDNAMFITWKTQYGNVIINVATPLAIEYDTTDTELITVIPSRDINNKVNKLEVVRELNKDNEKFKVNETHLRADHMLCCLLSLILITKRKNSDLLLNAPSVSLMYSTVGFKTKGLLTIEGEHSPVLVLEGRDIEQLLTYIIEHHIISPEDNFIPKFISNDYTKGYIDCGGKITTTSDRDGLTNIDDLFYCEGIPEFSTIQDEDRTNIYPGIIERVQNGYLCQLKTDDFGIYLKNEDLIDDEGKFYKVFLPTIIGESNKKNSKYWCGNYDTYKQILEGFAYNDVLLPKTKIESLQGKEIGPINAQEDIELPYFNLLYLNSINLKFHKDRSEHCSNETGGDYYRPADFCHGFAFITLFGDQSRFLDAHVFMANSAKGLSTAAWEVDKGWDADHCYGRNIYEYGDVDYDHFTAKCPEDQFRLGTLDWANAKIEKFEDAKAGEADQDIDMVPETDLRFEDSNDSSNTDNTNSNNNNLSGN